MSNVVIEPDAFGATVDGILMTYTKAYREASDEAVRESAEYCVEQIKLNIGKSGIKGTGAYRDSWIAEIETKEPGKVTYLVHAKAPYHTLTQLLEHGHQKWLWGKDTGERTKAYAHIGPAVRDMKKQFADKLKVKLSK